MKRVLCVLLVAAVLGGGLTAAAEPYQSYIYNAYGDPVYAPDLYTVRDTWSGGSLGIGELNEPGGLVCGADGYLYLTDTKNDRIIRLSPDLTEKTVDSRAVFKGRIIRVRLDTVRDFNLLHAL